MNEPEAESSAPQVATAATAPPAIVEPKSVVTPAGLAPLWGKVIRSQGISPILRAILTNSSLAALEGGKASIVCAPKFATGAPKWASQIAELVSREHGSPVEVSIRAAGTGEMIETPVPEPASNAPSAEGAESAPVKSAPPSPAPRVNVVQAAEHPLIKQALELFGGRVVDVQPRRQG